MQVVKLLPRMALAALTASATSGFTAILLIFLFGMVPGVNSVGDAIAGAIFVFLLAITVGILAIVPGIIVGAIPAFLLGGVLWAVALKTRIDHPLMWAGVGSIAGLAFFLAGMVPQAAGNTLYGDALRLPFTLGGPAFAGAGSLGALSFRAVMQTLRDLSGEESV